MINKKGIQLEKSVDVLETGFRNPGVLSAVLSGEADFGLLAYCELETALKSGALELGKIKVVSDSKKRKKSVPTLPSFFLTSWSAPIPILPQTKPLRSRQHFMTCLRSRTRTVGPTQTGLIL